MVSVAVWTSFLKSSKVFKQFDNMTKGALCTLYTQFCSQNFIHFCNHSGRLYQDHTDSGKTNHTDSVKNSKILNFLSAPSRPKHQHFLWWNWLQHEYPVHQVLFVQLIFFPGLNKNVLQCSLLSLLPISQTIYTDIAYKSDNRLKWTTLSELDESGPFRP